MSIDKAIFEMSKELLPSLSYKEDIAAIRELRKLYKKDKINFEKKLFLM
jgi:hypothetical protein